MTEFQTPSQLLQLSCSIVGAYISNNRVPPTELLSIIKSVHGALTGLTQSGHIDPTLKPAVPIKKSVAPEYIVCLEDGKKLKMLKRYLQSRYKLSPEEYRHKWGLPVDYPMVAPNYSVTRSALAKKSGLGRRPSVSKKRKRT